MPTNPGYRHGPILDTQRKRCPVCHQSVYSLAGIHPQCAIKLSEAVPPVVPTPVEVDPESTVAVIVPAKTLTANKTPLTR
jgi:hypothetical protein